MLTKRQLRKKIFLIKLLKGKKKFREEEETDRDFSKENGLARKTLHFIGKGKNSKKRFKKKLTCEPTLAKVQQRKAFERNEIDADIFC